MISDQLLLASRNAFTSFKKYCASEYAAFPLDLNSAECFLFSISLAKDLCLLMADDLDFFRVCSSSKGYRFSSNSLPSLLM